MRHPGFVLGEVSKVYISFEVQGGLRRLPMLATLHVPGR